MDFWGALNIRLNTTGRPGRLEGGFRTNQTINLDMYLHNDNGRFAWNWPSVGFHASAKNIKLAKRRSTRLYEAGVKVMEYPIEDIWITAKLQNSASEWKDAVFQLDGNITIWAGYFKVLNPIASVFLLGSMDSQDCSGPVIGTRTTVLQESRPGGGSAERGSGRG